MTQEMLIRLFIIKYSGSCYGLQEAANEVAEIGFTKKPMPREFLLALCVFLKDKATVESLELNHFDDIVHDILTANGFSGHKIWEISDVHRYFDWLNNRYESFLSELTSETPVGDIYNFTPFFAHTKNRLFTESLFAEKEGLLKKIRYHETELSILKANSCVINLHPDRKSTPYQIKMEYTNKMIDYHTNEIHTLKQQFEQI